MEYWIWLAECGLSDRILRELLEEYGSAERIYDHSAEIPAKYPELKPELQEKLLSPSLTEAQQILRLCAQKQIRVLTIADPDYPARLHSIFNPPLVLYIRGHLPDVDGNAVIAMVGTRHPSAYGLSVAQRLGYQVGRCGGIVVSGLALGIDAACMNGALLSGCPVIGVLGCGVDVVYPKTNTGLYNSIAQYGCLISEYPPETTAQKWYFPRRNRIISGLSCGVAVVEAPERSGSLITASQAAEQGRDVFAVPGNVDMEGFVGSNRLLRTGAIAVSSGWDILSEYEAVFPDRLHSVGPEEECPAPETVISRSTKVAQKPLTPVKKAKLQKNLTQNPIDNGSSEPYIDLSGVLKGLGETERRLLGALTEEPRLLDDVIAETGIPSGKMLAMLTVLELKGLVRRHPGRRISRAGK